MPQAVARIDDIKDVAIAIRRWAEESNLLRIGGGVPTNNRIDQIEGAIAMSDEARSVLERQKVTAVGFSRTREKIFIYTNKIVTGKNKNVLPTHLNDAYPVEYKQAKPVNINPEHADDVLGPSPYFIHNGAYACGSSIGIGSVRMAGTLGCIVKDADDNYYGLTNNHVSGGCNNTRVGMPIVAPGILDVSVNERDPFTIGHHHSVLTMRQGEPGTVNHLENTDAALISIGNLALVSSNQGEAYDTPSECVDPIEDMIVEKVGRSTGHTIGTIESELVGSLPVGYKTVVHHNSEESSQFVGTVHFEPVYLIRGNSGAFALPGDSGSLVTTVLANGARKAIGLVFAGVAPNTSYMLPLRPVLERFGVSLVSNHNVTLHLEDGGSDPSNP